MNNINNDHNPRTRLSERLFATMKYLKKDDIVGKRILNIGCGFGWFEIRAAKLGAKKVIGIEITEKDLAVAKKNIRIKNVDFIVGSAIDLPFPDNYFDTIVSWEVIEHIPINTESKMFSEVKRVLKPNGRFYLSTPSSNFYTKIFDPAWWMIGHRHYSIEKIRELSKNHLHLISAEYRASWWTLIGLLNMYISKWVFRRAPFYQSFFTKKITKEYLSPGFFNLFATFKK